MTNLKFDRSLAQLERMKSVITAGTNSPGRLFKDVETPALLVKSADGARITDADGNEYIDFLMGLGPNILGHNPEPVQRALREQLSRGTVYGINSELEIELAERIVGACSHIDEIRFTCSGTEAVMTAIRVARAHTNKPCILKFRGGYHGHSDGVLTHSQKSSVRNTRNSVKDGIIDAVRGTTLISEYNDAVMIEETFREHGDSIAAAIVEPIATNMGLILPNLEFLQRLRASCDAHGAILIFDEVVSGFRFRHGVISDELGIIPDLTTFGKIIGGGLPVGAFGGSKDLMSQVGHRGGVFQGGSFAGNPLTMAAGIATLDALADGKVYNRIEGLTRRFTEITRQKFAEASIPFSIQSYGTLATYIFHNELRVLRNFGDVSQQNFDIYAKFHLEMAKKGVLFAPTIEEPIFFGAAHTEDDIEYTATTAVNILSQILAG
jgi:glutamate-1-semialdehyde 2,1-aminomutase